MGLLLTFTPCVLPMVPILSSLIVGATRDGRPRMRDGAMLSLAYILPMATTYAGLGVAAALAGANLQVLFQAPAFIVSFAALFVLLALAMFGAFEMALPSGLQTRLDAWMARQRGGRLGGAAVMGVLSALLVGPCMTAPLAGALLYIADSGDAWQGALALWSLGLGMGAPLLAVGLLGTTLIRSLDVGFHIKTGERVLDEGAIPRTDAFSFTREGAPTYRKRYYGPNESQVWEFDRRTNTFTLLHGRGQGGCRWPRTAGRPTTLRSPTS